VRGWAPCRRHDHSAQPASPALPTSKVVAQNSTSSVAGKPLPFSV
jgi:hypothetical protein